MADELRDPRTVLEHVGVLARALPSLRGIPGVDPFDAATLAINALESVQNMQEYTDEVDRELSRRGAWLSSYAEAPELHAIQDRATRSLGARDAAARRYAAASLVLSCLPRAAQGGDARKVAGDFRARDLMTLLEKDDRAAFARWLMEAEDAPPWVHDEATAELAEGIERRHQDETAAHGERRSPSARPPEDDPSR